MLTAMTTRIVRLFLPAVAAASLAACSASQTPVRRTHGDDPPLAPASRVLSDSETRNQQRNPMHAPMEMGAAPEPASRLELAPRDVDACPVALQGVAVAAIPLEDGMALSFRARGADTQELRARVRSLAVEYQKNPVLVLGSAWARADDNRTDAPAISVHVVDIAAGSKVVVTAAEQPHSDSLRMELRNQADEMLRGSCAFLSDEPR
jgi:hypothetical protein